MGGAGATGESLVGVGGSAIAIAAATTAAALPPGLGDEPVSLGMLVVVARGLLEFGPNEGLDGLAGVLGALSSAAASVTSGTFVSGAAGDSASSIMFLTRSK